MDLKGSLVDTNLRIIPTESLVKFLKTINISKEVPSNIIHIIKDEDKCNVTVFENVDTKLIQITDTDFQNIKKVKDVMNKTKPEGEKSEIDLEVKEKNEKANENDDGDNDKEISDINPKNKKELDDSSDESESKEIVDSNEPDVKQFLTTSDLDWLYIYIKSRREKGNETPYLHELLKGVEIKVPPNKTIKRNPDLEARCVKLRAQQEAREYRKMTKGVDNVRIRYPEDSISYQLKQVNRHLIAIGQFLLSIFAGFLFGFRGVEWIIGNLDFGFRLLLGVMCALVIALAEIYFLAKKLNEELSVPETVQLGGPPKFANEVHNISKKAIDKEHKD